MATPFPLNQITRPPVLIAARLLPLMNKYIETLQNFALLELPNLTENIPTNASCDDIDIRELRNKLESLLISLNKLNDLISILDTVISALRIIVRISRISTAAALAVPLPIPPPAQLAINAISELIKNAVTVIDLLKISLTRLSGTLPNIIQSIQSAEQLLNSTCNESSNISNSLFNNLLSSDNISIIPDMNSKSLSEDDILNQYPSVFYTELNVSDSDLNARYQEIVKILNDGFDVFNNLNEIPSQVIRGQGTPLNNIGKSGDFYINSQTNQLFGPKPTNESWT